MLGCLRLVEGEGEHLVEFERGVVDLAAGRLLDHRPKNAEGERDVEVVVYRLLKLREIFFRNALVAAGRRLLMLEDEGEQARISRLRRLQAFEGEVELFAVVRVEAEIAEVERLEAALFEVRDAVSVAQRLTHLAVVHEHKFAVHPIIHALFARERLVLRDLVFVVDGDMVDAARMDVEGHSQIFEAHGAAFDVPAGITHAPGAFPLHAVLGFGFFPKREVGGVTLLAVHLDARARLLFVQVEAGELAVAGELRDVEINAVVDLVAVALFHELLNVIYHLLDVLGGFGDDLGLADIELFEVFEKDFRIKFRDLPRRLFLLARGFLHLVLALVAVAQKMPHVRDVHHSFELIAVIFERAAENIHENISAQIADMREVVDRRSAAVHIGFPLVNGDEIFLLTR